MKLIGVEVRVRAHHHHNFREVRLIPLEIVIPAVGNELMPEAEVTFHTTSGDVTVRAQLPDFGRRFYDHELFGQPHVQTPSEAVAYLDRQIEAGV